MADLSVIVVSWNAKAFVNECLQSLARQNLSRSIEVILVDNASTDGTPEMVRLEFPNVFLIQNPSNVGFAKANNIGLKKATGQYLALINSDVNVPPNCLQTLCDYLDVNPTVGVVAPRMLGPDGHLGRSYMRFPSFWNCFCRAVCLDRIVKNVPLFGGVLMTDFAGDKTCAVDVLNGWFLAIRREALGQVGLLDERFFMYGEDLDWCYRFHKAGWSRIYFSEACAVHYGGSSSSAAPTRFYVELQKANLQYWEKHHRYAGLLGYKAIVLLDQALRLAGHSLAYLFSGSNRLQTTSKIRRSAACIAWLLGFRSRENVCI